MNRKEGAFLIISLWNSIMGLDLSKLFAPHLSRLINILFHYGFWQIDSIDCLLCIFIDQLANRFV